MIFIMLSMGKIDPVMNSIADIIALFPIGQFIHWSNKMAMWHDILFTLNVIETRSCTTLCI